MDESKYVFIMNKQTKIYYFQRYSGYKNVDGKLCNH